MGLTRYAVLTAVAAAALAACGEAPSTPAEAPQVSASSSVSSPGSFANLGTPRMMPLITGPNAVHHNQFAAAPSLQYQGGAVIPNVKIVAVMWGSSVDSSVSSQVAGFFTAVNDSAYFDWLTEYNTATQTIGRGTFDSVKVITPSATGTSLSDTAVANELDAQITAGHLPAPDANTMYMTYFPPGVVISQGGQSSCQAFCAYHNSFTHGSTAVYYGVVPDYGPGSGCDQGCGSNPTMFDNISSASTHEMIEAVTDADVGNNNIAWYDNSYGEIGDICADPSIAGGSIDGQIAGYTVQKEWSNSRNSCIVQDASVPTPTPTAPPPTPTPSATATPGGNGGHGHGANNPLGGCDVGDLGAVNGAFLGLLSAAALAAAKLRRRE